jgi:oligosaccharide repeat unit polymerase
MRAVVLVRRSRVVAAPLFTVLVGMAVAAGVSWLLERFEDSALFIISMIVLIGSSVLMHHLVGAFNLRRLTIPGFWFLTYLVMLFAPSFFVFASNAGMNRYRYLFAVQSTLVTVPLGVLVVNRALGFRRREIDEYFTSAIPKGGDHSAVFLACILGFLLAAGVAVAYFSKVETVPLFYLLRHPGDYETLVLLREESFKLLDSRLRYVYYLLRIFGFSFLIMVTLGYYLETRRLRWFVMFSLSLGVGLLYGASSIAKSPPAQMLAMALLFVYLCRGGMVSVRGLTTGVVVVSAFPVGVVAAQSGLGNVGWVGAVRAIASRVFYEPAEVLYWYFELFPTSSGYLYGRSIGVLSRLLGWEHFDTANYVGLYGLRSRIESVNANAAFIGNLYADFGMVGVLVGGIVVGALMQIIQVYLIRQPKNVPNLAVYSYLMMAFWLLHSTALPVVLGSNGALLALAFLWVFRSCVSVLRIHTRWR